MVCDPDETDLNIHIPAVMLPQDAGTSLEKMLISNSSGKLYLLSSFIPKLIFLTIDCRFINWYWFWKFDHWLDICTWHLKWANKLFLSFLKKFLDSAVSVQLYSPLRPPVDIAEVFLWLMAVGTILCSSFWSAWSAREAAIEQDKLLKVT